LSASSINFSSIEPISSNISSGFIYLYLLSPSVPLV
jgi:hypothetical protein